MKVKRDVSCTSTLHYSELRGAEPNPLDFRTAMEEIRGKTASLFLSLPHACYSSPVLWRLILVCVEILICFNMKRLEKWAYGYITEMTRAQTQRKCPTGQGLSDLQQPDGCFPAEIQLCRMKQPLITGHVTEFVWFWFALTSTGGSNWENYA